MYAGFYLFIYFNDNDCASFFMKCGDCGLFVRVPNSDGPQGAGSAHVCAASVVSGSRELGGRFSLSQPRRVAVAPVVARTLHLDQLEGSLMMPAGHRRSSGV